LYPEHYFLSHGIDNPVKFGLSHKEEIGRLLNIANFELLQFQEVKDKLENILENGSSMEKYWALIVCSSFGQESSELSDLIGKIAGDDAEPINRVRAAECLALQEKADPQPVILDVLNSSTDLVECWLTLNTVTLLKDIKSPYAFKIDRNIFPADFLKDRNIVERLNYINEEAE